MSPYLPSRPPTLTLLFALAALSLAACGDDTSTTDARVSDAALDGDGAADTMADVARADLSRADATKDWSTADKGQGTVTYTCKKVGTSASDGFFSLASFGGALYAGQFGYGFESQSMLYRYPPWGQVTPGLVGIGESVCALRGFGGAFYANTEHSGDIFRSTDGSTWTRIHDGRDGVIGCGLAELGGTLYAVNYDYQRSKNGKVLRLQGGAFSTVFDSAARPLYLREIVSYKGKLYAFGVENGQGKMLVSADGQSFQQSTVPQRYFRAHVWGGYLWLGSAALHASGKTSIWRYDGATFVEVHPEPQRSHVAALQAAHGTLFAATSNGWKTASGPSTLLVRTPGVAPGQQTSWTTICTFSETATWALAVHGGELYAASWHFGQKGHVYHVQRSDI